MTDPDHIYLCESCRKPIYAGDKYQLGGDYALCPDHAATLKDILDFWEDDIASGKEWPHWPDAFDSLEEAQNYLNTLREQVVRDGPDFKPLREAQA